MKPICLTFCTSLLLTACGLPPQPDPVQELADTLAYGLVRVEDREELADDLARLDQLCWFISIQRTQNVLESKASVHCKAITGGLSDVQLTDVRVSEPLGGSAGGSTGGSTSSGDAKP